MSRLMQRFRTVFRGLVICATFAAPLVTRAAPQSRTATAATIDVAKLGPQVGEKVPDFSLPDQHGQTRTLASLMGAKGLVLVFNRSADW